eukprot:11997493-Alexandrium_andersonii.AAC.1
MATPSASSGWLLPLITGAALQHALPVAAIGGASLAWPRCKFYGQKGLTACALDVLERSSPEKLTPANKRHAQDQ